MMKTLNNQSMQTKRCLINVMAIAMMLYVADAFTETLKDPTQPPAMLNNALNIENETPTGPVLQSIMIGPQIHAAIINGEKVLLGKKFQTATLIKLSEHEAILRYPDMSTQTLTMDFAMRKKLISDSIDTSKSKRKDKQYSILNTQYKNF